MIGYLLGIGAALALLKKRQQAKAIGAVKKAKRRVFAEVSVAQKSGIDFEQKAEELDPIQLRILEEQGERFGWNQSKRSVEKGTPYGVAYFNSLRRAYRQVSGIGAVPSHTDYKVRNADGNIVLIQRVYQPIFEHVQAETPEPVVETIVPEPEPAVETPEPVVVDEQEQVYIEPSAPTTNQSVIDHVEKEWQNRKEQYPESMFLFRHGDLYELFFDDAIEGSKALNVELKDGWYATVLVKDIDRILPKLVRSGFRVALDNDIRGFVPELPPVGQATAEPVVEPIVETPEEVIDEPLVDVPDPAFIKEQAPVETVTKQQAILDANPHLKVHTPIKDKDGSDVLDPITKYQQWESERTTDFTYLLLVSLTNKLTGKYECKNQPIMAFRSLQDAKVAMRECLKKNSNESNLKKTFNVVSVEKYNPKTSVMGIGWFGGNSGYDGYSMSIRAKEAREEGRYPKTDFKKVYGINDRTLEVLVDLKVIDNTEWHHTSKYGNKTTFYSWYDENDFITYSENKKLIQQWIKENNFKPIADMFGYVDVMDNPYTSYGTDDIKVGDHIVCRDQEYVVIKTLPRYVWLDGGDPSPLDDDIHKIDRYVLSRDGYTIL